MARIPLHALFLCTLLWCTVPTGVDAGPSLKTAPAPGWILTVTPDISGKPSSKDYAGGYYLAFIDLQINLVQRAAYRREIRAIESGTGVQNASEIAVSFDPSYEQVFFHEVLVWRDGAAVSRLKPEKFTLLPTETDKYRFLYNGRYHASLVLDDIRKGDRIEFSYTIQGWNPIREGKFGETWYFSAYDYISHIHKALIAEPGRVLHFTDFNKPPQRKKRNLTGHDIYEWELKEVRKTDYEDYVPVWWNVYPRVQISEYRDWKEVVHWGLRYYTVGPATGEVLAKVKALQKQAEGNPQKFLETAVEFVQNEVRYLGIEIGEHSHKPHAPEKVLKQLYGDCKDKSLLLSTLLQANGIKAYPALVATYMGTHLSDLWPDPMVFDHVIVGIETPEGMEWIDPTISLQQRGESGYSIPAYGKALLLKPGEAALRPIESPSKDLLTVLEKITLRPDRDSSSLFKVYTQYTGGQADQVRADFEGGLLSDIEQRYLNYYRDTYKNASLELQDSLSFFDNKVNNHFVVTESYLMDGGWVYDSSRKKEVFTIIAKMVYDQLTQLPNRTRKAPVALVYPYNIDYTVMLEIGEDWKISHEKWEVSRDSYRMSFNSEFDPSEYIWTLRYQYQTFKDHIPVSEVGTYKADMDKFTEFRSYELTSPGAVTTQWSYGIFSLWLACMGLLAFTAYKVYRYSPPGSMQPKETTLPIGGWLILMAVVVVVSPFVYVWHLFFDSSYFDPSLWNRLNGADNELAYKGLLSAELWVNSILLCYSVLAAILFFQRRNTFPEIFTIVLASSVAFQIADLLFAGIFLTEISALNSETGKVLRAILHASLWIMYLHKSERVKNTFVHAFQNGKPVRQEQFPGDLQL